MVRSMSSTEQCLTPLHFASSFILDQYVEHFKYSMDLATDSGPASSQHKSMHTSLEMTRVGSPFSEPLVSSDSIDITIQ